MKWDDENLLSNFQISDLDIVSEYVSQYPGLYQIVDEAYDIHDRLLPHCFAVHLLGDREDWIVRSFFDGLKFFRQCRVDNS